MTSCGRKAALFALLLGPLVGCAAEYGPPLHPTIALEAPDTVWIGSELVLYSPAFDADTEYVYFNDTRAATSVIDPSHISARTPDSAGTYEVGVFMPGIGLVVVDTITALGGFRDFSTLSFAPSTDFAPAWPDPTGVRVVAYGSGGLLSLDLRHPETLDTLLPETVTRPYCSSYNPWGPFASGGRLTLPGNLTDCRFVAWSDVAGVLTPVDTGPAAAAALYVGNGRWVFRQSYYVYGRNSDTTVMLGYNEGGSFTASADGSRVTYASGGIEIPLLNTATMTRVAVLHGLRAVGASFSFTGDTLFMAVNDSRTWLYSVSAATGSMVATGDSVPGYNTLHPGGVTLDPAGPWLYLTGGSAEPQVFVIDRRTMRVVTRLAPRPGAVPAGSGCDAFAYGYVDSGTRTLFLLCTATVLRFELMP